MEQIQQPYGLLKETDSSNDALQKYESYSSLTW